MTCEESDLKCTGGKNNRTKIEVGGRDGERKIVLHF